MLNNLKRITAILTAALLLIGLAACAGKTPSGAVSQSSGDPAVSSAASASDSAAQSSGAEAASEPETPRSDTLVVYFSATGTTKRVAQTIASITGADIYEIRAAQAYTDADLNWNDSDSRTTKEQNDKSVRPAIAGETVSLSGYKTVYVGYPIWWGEEPRIMDTFVESCDFSGMTVIPFCTSSSSGVGRSGKNLAENAGSGNWLDGKRFGAGASETELRSWIEGLK